MRTYKLLKKCFDSFGRFIPDPTPVSIPAGFETPETLEQKIARVVRSQEMQRINERAGHDSFDEYDDFDDIDDPLPWTKYETSGLDPIQNDPSKAPEASPKEPTGVKGGVKPPLETKAPEAVKKPKVRRTIVEEEIDD